MLFDYWHWIMHSCIYWSVLQCDVVMNLSASQRCEFVKNTPDCTSDEGFIKYPVVTFCLFPPNLLPLAITLYVRTHLAQSIECCCVSLFVECDMFLFTYPTETEMTRHHPGCVIWFYIGCVSLWFCMLLKPLSRFLFLSFLLFFYFFQVIWLFVLFLLLGMIASDLWVVN